MQQHNDLHNRCKYRCAIAMGIVILLSILPLYLISRYAYLSADDFSYLATTAPVWDATHSISEVVHASASATVQRYFEWQGNFSFIFLTFLQPAAFGQALYGVTPVFVLTIFCAAFLFFCKVVLRNYMGASKVDFWLVSLPLLFLSVQYMYSPVEGLYWHPGAISYTFFYALGLVLLALLLLLIKAERAGMQIVIFAITVFLSIAVGGSNYSTVLLCVLVSLLLAIYCGLQRQRKQTVFLTIIFAILAICLLISMMAPGNALRQSQVGASSIPRGIILALVYGAYSFANATTLPAVVCFLFLIPLLYRLAQGSSFRFSHPLWAMLLLFGLYSSLGAPCFYALGFSIPERNINLIYFSYYLVVLLALFYCLGYLSRQSARLPRLLNALDELCNFYKRRFGTVFIAFCLIFTASCVGVCTITKGVDGSPAVAHLPAGVSAAQSLLNGEAKAFYTEMLERDQLCRSSEERDIVLSPLSAAPYVLAYMDITEDPNDWKNLCMAQYYEKNSITLQRK